MRVMCCGLNGQIGSFVAPLLLQRDKNMEIINISEYLPWQLDTLKGLPVIHIKADVREFPVIKSLMDTYQPDYFINFCAKFLGESFVDPFAVINTDLMGVINILEALRRQKEQTGKNTRFVQLSSAAVYGEPEEIPTTEKCPYKPTVIYGAAKASADIFTQMYHRCYGLDTIICRVFNQVGENQHLSPYSAAHIKFFLQMMKGITPTIHGDGNQTRDYCYAGDTAEGIVRAMFSDIKGVIVQFCSNTAISIFDLLLMCTRFVSNCNVPNYQINDAGHIQNRQGSNRLAYQLFDWIPKVTLGEALYRTYHWLEKVTKDDPTIFERVLGVK